MSRQRIKAIAALIALVGLTVAGQRPGNVAIASRSRVIRPAGLRTVAFYSRDLGGTTHLRVLLPEGYASTRRRYPVLYLLAGHTGTYKQWTTNSDVADYVRGLPLIVVMPDGGTGWYSNPASGVGPRWGDYLIDELVPYVDAHYRTVAGRAGRAVAGLSMGGLGAFDYAALHPDLFAAAASFSGYLNLRLLETPAQRHIYPDLAVFGDPRADALYWAGHDPVALAPNLRGVRLYLTSGNGQPGPFDRFHTPADPDEASTHAALLNMAAALSRTGITATVEDYGPGIHGWPYYARDLRHALPLIMDTFAHPPAAPLPWGYRTIARQFDVWGYQVVRTSGAPGWTALSAVSAAGLTAAGVGLLGVTTAALYRPAATYTLTVDGAHQHVVADTTGRLHLSIQLSGSGASHHVTIPAVRAP